MPTFGVTSLKRQPGAQYAVAKNGLATYDEQYKGSFSGSLTYTQGDQSDRYPNCVLLTAKITHTTGGGINCDEVIIDLHYEGKDDQVYNFEVAQELTVDSHVSLEPIDSHPDFVENIGGEAGAPLNGAQFDPTTGRFMFFALKIGSTRNRFAGVSSYYMPQVTVTQNRIDDTWPDISDLGSVVSTEADFPELEGDDRNYLYTAIRSRNIANEYFETQRVLMSSGPRGWMYPIYKNGSVP